MMQFNNLNRKKANYNILKRTKRDTSEKFEFH